MTNLPEKESIRIAINQYCAAKGISKNEFSNQVGVSDSTLSNIENGKWENINEKLWRKLWNRVSDFVGPELANTTDLRTCISLCKKAKAGHLMVALMADTGMGKSTALSAYSINKNVFYVVFDKTMAPKHFFTALLREMGIAFQGSINEMVNRICDELNILNNPLLIIDECGKLTHTMILFLHVLRDKTVKNCGVVLAGMPYFRDSMRKFSDKGKEGYAEFNRRINAWQDLRGLSRAEIESICIEAGIGDADLIREMQGKKRFGDLYNEILLRKIQNEEL